MRRSVVAGMVRGVTWALAGFIFLVATMARAEAAPAPLSLVVAGYSSSDSDVVVSGSVTDSNRQGVGNLKLTVSLDNTNQGSTVSATDGSFSYAMAKPASGSHAVTVNWAGDSRYGSASGHLTINIAASSQRAVALSIVIDPTNANPGTSIQVSGSLTSRGAPVPSALVSLSASYGDVDPTVVTGDDGAFNAVYVLSDSEGYPATFTLTATFAGDAVYQEATATASGSITAVAISADSAEPTLVASPTVSVAPAAPADVPSDSAAAAGNPVTVNKPAMAVVGVVFFSVAIVAVGTLIILGIISYAHKRLGRGERRGFGTDFGKEN